MIKFDTSLPYHGFFNMQQTIIGIFFFLREVTIDSYIRVHRDRARIVVGLTTKGSRIKRL